MKKIAFVSEAGVNHGGSLEIAKELCIIARAAQSDFVKFQKRSPRLCVPKEKWDEPKKTPWPSITTYGAYKEKIEFGHDEYDEIDKLCKNIGLNWCASAWDIPSAEFLIRYNTKLIKIPSAKIIDLELVEYCAQNFPDSLFVMSRGMSTKEEIDAAINIVEKYRTHNNYLLHSNSSYPAPLNELNLQCLYTLKELYPKWKIGYSGHEKRVFPSVIAAALEPCEMIERHFAKDRFTNSSFIGDISASLEPQGLIGLTNALKHLSEVMGDGVLRVYSGELEKRKSLRGY